MKVFIKLVCFSFLLSCAHKHDNYYQNKAVFENVVSEINNYFTDIDVHAINISKYYTDDFVFHSYAAGNKKGQETSKLDYIKGFDMMRSSGMLLSIGHSIYLPGLDQETFDFNGSVRVYYGATIKLDSVEVEFSGYQTIDFLDGKISEIWEWADYGGVNNEIMSHLN